MLQGKKILVAGAGGLLGSKLLVALLEQGATVVAVDINKTLMEQRLQEVGLKDTSKVSFVELDLNLEKYVEELFSGLEGLDGAVNCTYPRNSKYGAKFFDVKLSDFNENVSLHLGSSFLFMQQCAVYFRRERRAFSLVNISSIYGVVAPKFEVYDNAPMTMPVEYAAIKSAIIHLSRYLTTYVSDSLFKSNCVSPGGILDNQSEIFLQQYKKQCLGKGMLDIGDVLGSIIFLLSDHSKYMNGQNLIVDDGFSL